jgi:hypothetical protein
MNDPAEQPIPPVLLPGFTRQKSGPQAGLYWTDFSQIEIHGHPPGTPEYEHADRQKRDIIRKFVETELRLDTKHFNSKGDRLRKVEAVLKCFVEEGGFFIEIPKDRQWKFDAYAAAPDLMIGNSDDRTKNAGGAGPRIVRP